MLAKKYCRFLHNECSSRPIFVNANPAATSACDEWVANVTFYLPSEYGYPEVKYSTDFGNSKTYISVPDVLEHRSRHYSFRLNLETRRYPHVVFVTGHECRGEICKYEINSTIFDTCTSGMYPRLQEISNSTQLQQNNAGLVAVVAVLSVIGLLLIGGLLIYQIAKHCFTISRFVKARDQIPIDLDVFIVFLDEHPKHRDVVLKFATLLQASYSFNILLDLYDREKIYGNPAAWLENSLSSCDVVLVVWSPGAEKRWNNKENFYDQFDLFTPVLKQIKQDLILKRQLKKYMFAYFDYCSDSEIPSMFRRSTATFSLMAHFHDMLNNMISLKASSKKKIGGKFFEQDLFKKNNSEYFAILEQSIAEMKASQKISINNC